MYACARSESRPLSGDMGAGCPEEERGRVSRIRSQSGKQNRSSGGQQSRNVSGNFFFFISPLFYYLFLLPSLISYSLSFFILNSFSLSPLFLSLCISGDIGVGCQEEEQECISQSLSGKQSRSTVTECLGGVFIIAVLSDSVCLVWSNSQSV